MQFTTTSITDYIEVLSSEKPVPGGGAAAALSGAQGVALIMMVANLTVGKVKYTDVEELNQFALKEGEPLCKQLLGLIDRDAQAYNNLVASYKLPKETDKEKAARNAAIAEATLKATETPFEIMETSQKALYICKSLVGKSNTNVASDLGVSALNLLAGIKSAWFNVLVNLPGIKNEETAKYFKTKGLEIIETAQKEADFIYDSVIKIM